MHNPKCVFNLRKTHMVNQRQSHAAQRTSAALEMLFPEPVGSACERPLGWAGRADTRTTWRFTSGWWCAFPRPQVFSWFPGLEKLGQEFVHMGFFSSTCDQWTEGFILSQRPYLLWLGPLPSLALGIRMPQLPGEPAHMPLSWPRSRLAQGRFC